MNNKNRKCIICKTVLSKNRKSYWCEECAKLSLHKTSQKTKRDTFCVDCGKEIWYGSLRCKTCACKNNWKNEQYKRKNSASISNALKGRVFTEEWKNNISNWHKGRPLSEEHKQNISLGGRGKNEQKKQEKNRV